MGIIVSTNVFQEAIEKLMIDHDKLDVYINDIIIIGNSTYEFHTKDVKEVFKTIEHKGLQVNLDTSSWESDQVECLVFFMKKIEPSLYQEKYRE